MYNLYLIAYHLREGGRRDRIWNSKFLIKEKMHTVTAKYFLASRPTWAARNGSSHIDEAKCTSRERLPTAGTACNLGFGWGATHAILAEAPSLVGHS